MSGRPINNRELADNLCAASGFLSDVRSAHMRSFGTLVPRVFMTEVLARVGLCLGTPSANATEADRLEIAGILESLEDGMLKGDRETRNVIAILFAGDAELQPFFARLAPLLGPRLRAQLGDGPRA